MRLIDADALKQNNVHTIIQLTITGQQTESVIYAKEIDNAPTICCGTCKHGWKGERIGDHEYVCCTKPYAELSNYHIKDWFCGDWKNKDEVLVVRCKDCKHYEPLSDEGNIGICDANPTGKLASAHWYCPDGERKTNGNC